MRKSIFTIITTICITLVTSHASALEGVLLDSDGKYVRDGFGECVSVDKLKHFHKEDGSGYCKDETKKVAKPAPKPAPAPAPAPKVVEKNISLGAHALFDVDKDTLREAGRQELDTLAKDLHAVKRIEQITIVGHTDSTGAETYNQALSERRAATVRHYLISKGISSTIMNSIGMGESSPVASNASSEGRQQNRRVDISIRAIK